MAGRSRLPVLGAAPPPLLPTGSASRSVGGNSFSPVLWLVVGIALGGLASLSIEKVATPSSAQLSTAVTRAVAELRCECPVVTSSPIQPIDDTSDTAWWKVSAGKYGIVVVEPRLHPTLIFMITDTLAKIPPTWKALVFYSKKNEKFLRLALQPWIITKRITLAPFPSGNDDSYMFSNDMLLRPAFYNAVPFEKFLIMHTDGLVCRKDWDTLGRFVGFDYIGSPWRDLKVGNGGFSWRNRDLSLKIVNEMNPPLRDFPEDWYMAKNTEKYGGSVAPWDVAKDFGMETVWFEKPYGLHAAWHYQKNWTQIDCEGIELMGALHLAVGGVEIPGDLC